MTSAVYTFLVTNRFILLVVELPFCFSTFMRWLEAAVNLSIYF